MAMKPNYRGRMPPLSSFTLLLLFLLLLLMRLVIPGQAQLTQETRAGGLLFTQPSYNATIFENSAARTYLRSQVKMGVVLAPPRSLIISYAIVSGDDEGLFQAEDYTLGDFCFLRLRSNGGGGGSGGGTLNREVQDNYTLTLRASALGGQEALTTVYVTVLDTNDLRPLFSPTSYSMVVPESAPLGASVGRVTATDADVGPNGDFYYLFKGRVELFSIHPTSGVVSITGRPRMEEGKRFELEVQVVDRGMNLYGNNGASSTAKVVLTVERVNEFAPVLSVVALVPSWLDKEPVFAVVTVVDQDRGVCGDIEWVAVVAGDPSELFVVERSPGGNEYMVKTTDPADWGSFPSGSSLTLQAKDRGSPPKLSNKQSFQLMVAKPEPVMVTFEKDVYKVTLSEIAPSGTVVEVFRISPAPPYVNYSFNSSTSSTYFDMNPLTGVMVTAKPLTDIGEEVVEVEVVEAISGLQTKVQVTVEDANNNCPAFVQSSYVVSVNESTRVGTVILVVSALDEDKGENGCVSLTLATGGAQQQQQQQTLPFAIDPDTGELTVTRELDFESSVDVYTFAVRASDWGSPYRRESEVSVTVRLLNVNDNRPLFERVSCRGTITRDFPVGEPIVTMSAIDIDELELVRYSILTGNELDYFNLSPDSGALTLRRSLAAASLKVGVFNLKVVASDGEGFSEPTYVNVSLVRGKAPSRPFTCKDTRVAQMLAEKLLDKATAMSKPKVDEVNSDLFSVNRQTPQLDSFPSSVVVREDVTPGASIFQVKGQDSDAGFNGYLLYSVSDGNADNCFVVDAESGLITAFQPLDRERRDTYSLNVTVSDQGLPPRSDWRLLTVVVDDANDNDPRFVQDGYFAVVLESWVVGTNVVQVAATDRDLGVNAELYYTLLTKVPQFRIDSETGAVFVAGELDREATPTFSLKIEARDRAEGGADRSSVTTLSITLDDVNDCAPGFMPSSYSARVLEDLPTGVVIAWVEALDPDLGSGGLVRYSLPNDFNGTFEMSLNGVFI